MMNEITKENDMKVSGIARKSLIGILQKLGSGCNLFHREAQFQFELAMELQKLCGNNAKVYLEYASFPPDKNKAERTVKTKKICTDIIVADVNNGDYVAIELKYKTVKLEYDNGDKKVSLANQYAQDLGRYDFLYDVMRLQTLKERDPLSRNIKNFKKGFSILLTNDSSYWENSRKEQNKPLYNSFCISKYDFIHKGEDLTWEIGENKQEDEEKVKWRKEEVIKLEKDYDLCNVYKWKKYCDTGTQNGTFEFLILDVDGKEE